MPAFEIFVPILLVALIMTMLITIRGHLVFLLRSRLLFEESIWLQFHRDELRDDLLEDKFNFFERYRRLPSYFAMILKFWKTMGSFERKAGSIEQYYPLPRK